MTLSVGNALLDLAHAERPCTIAVVGTGKNAGKTVVLRALYASLLERGHTSIGLSSIGRDGEVSDITDAMPKPRLCLEPETILATAQPLLPPAPASELLERSNLRNACGSVVFARVRTAAYYELAGPTTAAGMRQCIERLKTFGTTHILIDGAIDRVAVLAKRSDAVIVCTGADTAANVEEAALNVRALVARLRIPAFDSNLPFVRLDGALTAGTVARFIEARESRQVVIDDPTRFAMSGGAALSALERLTIRCRHPLNAVAVTIASIGRGRYFEPRDFGRRVAAAVGLPTFDVYAGARFAAA